MIGKRTLLLITSASLLVAGSAYAENQTENKTKFYVGAELGYMTSDATHTFSNGAPSDDSDPEGATKGVFFGMKKSYDRIFTAAEISYSTPLADGEFRNSTLATSAGSVDIDSMLSLRLKLGYHFNDIQTTPYIIGGYAYTRADMQGGPIDAPEAGGFTESYSSFLVGAGVEYDVTKSLSLRLEYIYSDLGEESGYLDPGYPSVEMPVDITLQAFQLGISYNF